MGPGGDVARVAALQAGLPVERSRPHRRPAVRQRPGRRRARPSRCCAPSRASCWPGEWSRRPPPRGGSGRPSTTASPPATSAPRSRRRAWAIPTWGAAADLLAREFGVSRRAQDEYAARSHARAIATQQAGGFDAEIVPVGDVTADDRPRAGPVGGAAGPAAPGVPARRHCHRRQLLRHQRRRRPGHRRRRRHAPPPRRARPARARHRDRRGRPEPARASASSPPPALALDRAGLTPGRHRRDRVQRGVRRAGAGLLRRRSASTPSGSVPRVARWPSAIRGARPAPSSPSGCSPSSCGAGRQLRARRDRGRRRPGRRDGRGGLAEVGVRPAAGPGGRPRSARPAGPPRRRTAAGRRRPRAISAPPNTAALIPPRCSIALTSCAPVSRSRWAHGGQRFIPNSSASPTANHRPTSAGRSTPTVTRFRRVSPGDELHPDLRGDGGHVVPVDQRQLLLQVRVPGPGAAAERVPVAVQPGAGDQPPGRHAAHRRGRGRGQPDLGDHARRSRRPDRRPTAAGRDVAGAAGVERLADRGRHPQHLHEQRHDHGPAAPDRHRAPPAPPGCGPPGRRPAG